MASGLITKFVGYKLNEKDYKKLDDNPNSRYFQVFGITSNEYGLGNHSFRIYGSELLYKNSYITIEIRDCIGNLIYCKGVQKDSAIPAWLVKFTIDSKHESGVGKIYIAGHAKEFPYEGPDNPSVIWTREIQINPNLHNKSDIIFLEEPDISNIESVQSEDSDRSTIQRNFVKITVNDLETISGKVDELGIKYKSLSEYVYTQGGRSISTGLFSGSIDSNITGLSGYLTTGSNIITGSIPVDDNQNLYIYTGSIDNRVNLYHISGTMKNENDDLELKNGHVYNLTVNGTSVIDPGETFTFNIHTAELTSLTDVTFITGSYNKELSIVNSGSFNEGTIKGYLISASYAGGMIQNGNVPFEGNITSNNNTIISSSLIDNESTNYHISGALNYNSKLSKAEIKKATVSGSVYFSMPYASTKYSGIFQNAYLSLVEVSGSTHITGSYLTSNNGIKDGYIYGGNIIGTIVNAETYTSMSAGYFVNTSICDSTAVCYEECPVEAIIFNDDTEQAVINQETCIRCGNCESACPLAAIEYKTNIENIVDYNAGAGYFIGKIYNSGSLKKATYVEGNNDNIIVQKNTQLPIVHTYTSGSIVTSSYIQGYLKSGSYVSSGSAKNISIYGDFISGSYSGSYSGSTSTIYSSSLNDSYQGNFNGIYTGSLNGNYNGTLDGWYSGSYSGSINQLYSGSILGTFDGTFVGNYSGSMIGSYSGSLSGSMLSGTFTIPSPIISYNKFIAAANDSHKFLPSGSLSGSINWQYTNNTFSIINGNSAGSFILSDENITIVTASNLEIKGNYISGQYDETTHTITNGKITYKYDGNYVGTIRGYLTGSGTFKTGSESDWNDLGTVKVPSLSGNSGLNVNSFTFSKQLNITKQTDDLKFKLWFISPTNEIAKYYGTDLPYEISESVDDFLSNPQYLFNGVITGSVFIGKSTNDGIELSGMNSGFIRSVGYKGRGNGTPGFIIWSGSNFAGLTGSGNLNYQGVGFELYGNETSSFFYSTKTKNIQLTGSINAYSGRFSNNFTVGHEDSDSTILINVSKTGSIMQSNNWTAEDPNFSGWAILSNGKSYFTDVTLNGTITADSGKIGGWVINDTQLKSENNSIILDSLKERIQVGSGSNERKVMIDSNNGLGTMYSADYVSGLRGFYIDPSYAEFGNVSVRGELQATVFKKNTIQIANGIMIITDSGKIAEGYHLERDEPASDPNYRTQLYITENVFENGDILRMQGSGYGNYIIKKEYVVVTGSDNTGSSAPYRYEILRGYETNDYGHYWPEGTIIAKEGSIPNVNTWLSLYGENGLRSGSVSSSDVDGGWIKLDASSQYSPYIDIVTRADSRPAIGLNNKVRLGLLSGIQDDKVGLSIGNEEWGLYTDNGYFRGSIVAESGAIGGWLIESQSLRSANNELELRSGTTGTGSFYIISSSNFTVNNNGILSASNAYIDFVLSAKTGSIGEWLIIDGKLSGSNITLDADDARIYKTSDNNNMTGYYMDFTPQTGSESYYLRMGTDFAISGSGKLFASGAQIEGAITASSGKIGGWEIYPTDLRSTTYTSTNIGVKLNSDGTIELLSGSTGIDLIAENSEIKSKNYQPLQKGFYINPYFAEFGNVRVRGELRTAVFKKDVISVANGLLMITDSSMISSSFEPSHIYLQVTDNAFETNDILHLKDFVNGNIEQEYLRVISGSDDIDTGSLPSYVKSDFENSWAILVERNYESNYWAPGTYFTGSTWFPGTAIASEGNLDDIANGIPSGYILNDASTEYSPYLDVVTRTGPQPETGLTTKVRLGRLAGIDDSDVNLSLNNDEYGLYTDNAYLKGGIVASFGEIGGWSITTSSIEKSYGDNGSIVIESVDDAGSGSIYFGSKSNKQIQITNSPILNTDNFNIPTDEITFTNNGFESNLTNWDITVDDSYVTQYDIVSGGTIATYKSGGTKFTSPTTNNISPKEGSKSLRIILNDDLDNYWSYLQQNINNYNAIVTSSIDISGVTIGQDLSVSFDFLGYERILDIYGNNKWAIKNKIDFKIYTSPDNSTWTLRKSNTNIYADNFKWKHTFLSFPKETGNNYLKIEITVYLYGIEDRRNGAVNQGGIFLDNFKIYKTNNSSILTNDGLMIYNSPENYIKLTPKESRINLKNAYLGNISGSNLLIDNYIEAKSGRLGNWTFENDFIKQDVDGYSIGLDGNRKQFFIKNSSSLYPEVSVGYCSQSFDDIISNSNGVVDLTSNYSNMGFESYINNWTVTPDVSSSYTLSNGQGGSTSALQCYVTNFGQYLNGSSGIDSGYYTTNIIRSFDVEDYVKSGDIVEFSFYAKTGDKLDYPNTKNYLDFTITGDLNNAGTYSENLINSTYSTLKNNAWMKITSHFDIPNNLTDIKLNLNLNNYYYSSGNMLLLRGYINIDTFEIKINRKRNILSNEGFLSYVSEDEYIKISTNGISFSGNQKNLINPDYVPYLENFAENMLTPTQEKGIEGEGSFFWYDDSGKSHMEVDFMTIRKKPRCGDKLYQTAEGIGGTVILGSKGTLSGFERTN